MGLVGVGAGFGSALLCWGCYGMVGGGAQGWVELSWEAAGGTGQIWHHPKVL